jgi:chromosome segregation ATPase
MAIDPHKPVLPTSRSPLRPAGSQDIEQLRKRHTELDRKRAAAQANLDTANGNLQALKKQAMDAYGTDNLDELKAKLEAMKAENERRRAEYQKHLDEIETKLTEVEQQYQQSRTAEHS